ncbi:recombinase family protein [Aureimonas flava]|uniref:Recombinase family protein n=1 Tax=Aureimonas flava TaxID=2320271 RepID=A0A3A1WPR7_9HYPH|nr:recombinase family protein [Aureimonas flava]RIX99521.1 recombinase family protein [Aureimonas flava]
MLIGYARTSTLEQEAGLEAQKRDLRAAGCEEVYAERVSSVAAERGKLQAAIKFGRKGDTLVVTKVDRLARSAAGLWDIVQELEAKGVSLRVLNLGGDTVDTRSATGRLILTVFAGFAQFEREMMLERQREGIAKAKAEGKYKGRQPTAQAKAEKVRALAAEGMSMGQIAAQLGIGKGSVHRILTAKSADQAA